MTRETLEEKIEVLKNKEYYDINVWEAGGHFRLYISDGKYKKIGFIALTSGEVEKEKFGGKFKDIYYAATKGGNMGTLENVAKDILGIDHW